VLFRSDQRKCETNLIEKYTTTDHGRNISGNPNARWWNHLIGKNDDTYEGRPVSIYEGGGTCKKNRWRGCYLSKMQNKLI
jgi:hypothetical protein